MNDWLTIQRQARPEGLALTFQGQTWNYAQLDEMVTTLCERLASLGLQTGEVLAVHLANSPAYVGLIHALARLGLVLAPLNTRLTLPELALQIKVLGAKVMISATLNTTSLAEANCTCQVISLTALENLPGSKYRLIPLDLDRLQAVVFTSGTSGTPKGAMVTFGQHFWSALGSAFRLGVLPEDRWMSVLPLYHVGGLAVVFRSCLYGTTINLHAGFDLDAVRRSFNEEAVTIISLVPTMLQRMLSANMIFPNTLRQILLGGAAATTDLLEACSRNDLPVAVTYGLTEAASQVATLPPDSVRKKPGCAGKPLQWNQVQIRDEEDAQLPPGEIGEICVAGPVVMPGYWQDEPATQMVLHSGWLFTGDLGYLDADGDLWVVQRRTDLILSGGENVYPAEVETVIRLHPAVMDVCVVGLQDIDWGQRVAAALVLHPGYTLAEAELIDFLRPRLAGFKLPRSIRFLEALPLTATGKVARHMVAASFEAGSKNG